ncbi:MAG TPA: hypothetical protein VFA68_08595 [Terriglobales bacterium]|nr:hypothetical protein [Terriglobales bacterium]
MVFKGFVPVDEDDGDFVAELAAQRFIGIDIDFAPAKAASFLKFGQAFFNDFAQVASLAGVHNDVAASGHAAQCSKEGADSGRGY